VILVKLLDKGAAVDSKGGFGWTPLWSSRFAINRCGMLLCGIINELNTSTKLTDPKASTLLSYFFC
jgi:hypothetical protein